MINLGQKRICPICKQRIGLFEKIKKIELINGKEGTTHYKCFISSLGESPEFKAAIKNAQINQIKECLKIKAYCTYSPKELTELGFSEKDIEKMIANNYNEMIRLVKYSNGELLKMGLPISEIKKIREMYKKMEEFYLKNGKRK